jgi:hypothetical protein
MFVAPVYEGLLSFPPRAPSEVVSVAARCYGRIRAVFGQAKVWEVIIGANIYGGKFKQSASLPARPPGYGAPGQPEAPAALSEKTGRKDSIS